MFEKQYHPIKVKCMMTFQVHQRQEKENHLSSSLSVSSHRISTKQNYK